VLFLSGPFHPGTYTSTGIKIAATNKVKDKRSAFWLWCNRKKTQSKMKTRNAAAAVKRNMKKRVEMPMPIAMPTKLELCVFWAAEFIEASE